jgi:hypothetical protein
MLSFYLDGGMYTFLYPLDARHPDPPQLGSIGPRDSPVGISEIDFAGVGDSHARAIGCLDSSRLTILQP